LLLDNGVSEVKVRKMSWDTVWHIYLDSIGVSINLLVLSLVVLSIGLYKRWKGVKTRFFSIAFLIALVGIAYFTLHGRILQLIFPISLPENPFHFMTIANYVTTVAFTFVVFPILFLFFSHQLDAGKLGLRVRDGRYTVRLTVVGVCVNSLIVMFPTTISILLSWNYKWPFSPTTLDLLLWFVLVGGVATWMQVFFFLGILFHNNLDSESPILLFVLSVLTFLMFTPLTVFTPLYTLGLGVEAYITLKTRNIYRAMFIRSLGVAISTLLVL